MPFNQEDDIEEMADDSEMYDVDYVLDNELLLGEMENSESDEDEYRNLDPRITDTSSAQARRGKDIQGIPWDRLDITRNEYRQTTLEEFNNYESIPASGERSKKACKPTGKGGKYYEFQHNTRIVRSTRLHLQIRNLVWATSKHDIYLMSRSSIIHLSPLTSQKKEIINVAGHVAPCESHPGSILEGFSQTYVSTMAVRSNLLVVGGYDGELICKFLDRPGISFCSRLTYDDKAITNAIEIYLSHSGALHIMAANNDCCVRDFDMETFQLSKHFRFSWPVNYISLCPEQKFLVVVGDDPDGVVVDSQTGKTVAELKGHLDYSFTAAWHPNGINFATGNQDMTCRIWDIRNLSESICALRGNLGAIRSVRFSSDGQFMAMAEHTDFVHIFDVKGGYNTRQEVDFFGEISGISFSPDTEALFIGIWVQTYGSLLQYSRRGNCTYLDSMF